MANGTAFDPGSVRRALSLGMVVFVAFVVASGALLWAGMALGLSRIVAFLVAVCVGPALVSGVTLLWLFSMPAERRQRLLGVTAHRRKIQDIDPADSPPAE
jgi:hypothetical protein